MKVCKKIYPSFFVAIALSVLILPIRWVICWITAACVHEIFHWLALKILKIPIRGVYIKWNGAVIRTDRISGIPLAICAILGPIGSLLLAVFVNIAPRLALCGLFQAAYNLLPIVSLDGGNVICGILTPIFGEIKAEKIVLYISTFVISMIVMITFYTAVRYKLGLMPLIMLAILLVKYKNLPCKDRTLRVQ